jgi:MATE family multidrug resistance protein
VHTIEHYIHVQQANFHVSLRLKITSRLLVKADEIHIATLAETFARLLIPGVWPFVLFRVFSSYLAAQNRVYPPLIIGVAANIINIILNFLLVTGIGYESLGYVGAPIATSISRWCYFLLILGVLFWDRKNKPQEQVTESASQSLLRNLRDAIKWKGMKEYIKLAIPSALMLALEAWCFSLMTLLSSLLSATITAANAIVLNVSAMTIMVPISIGVAAGIRIGNNIGSGNTRGAKLACWSSLVVGVLIMACNGLLFVVLRRVLAMAFTDDLIVRDMVETILPIAALFQVFDGSQVICGGIIQGIGRQVMGVVANILGYYIIGIPVGSFLAFYIGWRVTGLWWGLAIGLIAVSIGLATILAVLIDWKKEAESAAIRISGQMDDITPAQSDGKPVNMAQIEDIMAQDEAKQEQLNTAVVQTNS